MCGCMCVIINYPDDLSSTYGELLPFHRTSCAIRISQVLHKLHTNGLLFGNILSFSELVACMKTSGIYFGFCNVIKTKCLRDS